MAGKYRRLGTARGSLDPGWRSSTAASCAAGSAPRTSRAGHQHERHRRCAARLAADTGSGLRGTRFYESTHRAGRRGCLDRVPRLFFRPPAPVKPSVAVPFDTTSASSARRCIARLHRTGCYRPSPSDLRVDRRAVEFRVREDHGDEAASGLGCQAVHKFFEATSNEVAAF